ncbi:MAG: tetratricopeptide repeat protein [Deltaproteobacteria bacterium]|nr:tetratricopeptide repeat protein [Deltaproteobacteria bacterium]
MTFFRSEMLHGRFLILLALTALFVFLPVSGSSGGDAEDEYRGFYVVSSYKNFDGAAALVDRLRAQGYDPFCKTVNIPKKGKWRRVFVKQYGDKKKALLAGKKLREDGVIKSFIILKTEPEDKRATPVSVSYDNDAENEYYSACVASYKNFNNAVALRDNLKTQGYDSFCETVNLPKKGKWHRVLIGRYKNKGEAMSAGMEAEVRERGEIKSFIILKTEPEDKRAAPRGNTDTEDNKNTPPRPALIKTEILFVPSSIKRETPPSPASTKGKTAPPNTEEIAPPRKARKAEADLGLKTGVKLYDSAMSDFTAGRYEDALGKFKEIIKTEKNETVPRRIADCYYFLGEKGDDRYFSKAIDQYRNIIRNYPDSGKKNAQATYRLAGSYSRLNLYYEALMEFENLCSKYPGSDYISESLYMAGKMFYETKRFNEAIKKFKEYIKKFPDGKYIKAAYFSVGDCYSRMRQFNDADVWYGDVLERWPALEDIPEDTLSNLGSHYFQAGKYDDALRVFFVYLNLFPDGNHCRNTLYTIARSFEEMGQSPLALKALSLVIERYPGSREAQRSALTMANIGVSYPEIKLPTHIFPGMDYYEAPIEAYDKMVGKLSDLDMKEELVFRKGEALIKSGRHREAFDNYRVLLDKFSYGTYRKAGEKNLALSAKRLINDYYSKEDYTAVLEVYFNSDRNVLFRSGDFDTLFKIGNSLKKVGLADHASGFFGEMINIFGKDKRIKELFLAAAEVDYGRGHYEDAKKRLKRLLKGKSAADKRTVAAAGKLMGDISCKEGLFKGAAGFYSEVLDSEAGVEDIAAVRKKYADSLREMGYYSSALINYERVLKECKGRAQKCLAPVVMGSYEGAGDCLYGKGKYRQAILMYKQSMEGIPKGKQSIWTIINMARGYANLGNKPVTNKLFSSLKGESGDEFWSRVADYYAAGNDPAGQ